jgi:hypothetical protein
MNSIKTFVLTAALLTAVGAHATAAESVNDLAAINGKLNTLIAAQMNKLRRSLDAQVTAVLKAINTKGNNRKQKNNVVDLQPHDTATTPAVKVDRLNHVPEADRS